MPKLLNDHEKKLLEEELTDLHKALEGIKINPSETLETKIVEENDVIDAIDHAKYDLTLGDLIALPGIKVKALEPLLTYAAYSSVFEKYGRTLPNVSLNDIPNIVKKQKLVLAYVSFNTKSEELKPSFYLFSKGGGKYLDSGEANLNDRFTNAIARQFISIYKGDNVRNMYDFLKITSKNSKP